MINAFKDWAQTMLGAGYVYSMGQWVDRPEVANRYLCAILLDGGPPTANDIQKPRFRVILLGPVSGRQYANTILADAQSLIDGAIAGDIEICGGARIGAASSVTGPGYTTEGRPWCSVEFEAIF